MRPPRDPQDKYQADDSHFFEDAKAIKKNPLLAGKPEKKRLNTV
jgi:hypothetical protein